MNEEYTMKKLLLILMLAFVSSRAMAEWVEIAKDEEETFSAYADPATIRKADNRVKIWVLTDHKIAQEPDDMKSSISLDEYDCKKKERRLLFLSAYSGHMTEGETIFTYNERSDWLPVPSGSVSEGLLEFACRFRSKPPRNFVGVIFQN